MVDYVFYTTEYLRGKESVIPEKEFAYYASNAERDILTATYGRAGFTTDEEKMCVCELAEIEYVSDNEKHKSVVSEKVGGYSVTYENSEQIISRAAQQQNKAILRWLANTGLLYRGIC